MDLVEIPGEDQRSVGRKVRWGRRRRRRKSGIDAIDDTEHHVCNVTLSSDTRNKGKFKEDTFPTSFNFFSRALDARIKLGIIAFQSSLGERRGEKGGKPFLLVSFLITQISNFDSNFLTRIANDSSVKAREKMGRKALDDDSLEGEMVEY